MCKRGRQTEISKLVEREMGMIAEADQYSKGVTERNKKNRAIEGE